MKDFIEKGTHCEGRTLRYPISPITFSPTRKIAGKHIRQLRFNISPHGGHPPSLGYETNEAKLEDIL